MIYPEFIYILDTGKYARGRAGDRAKWVARYTPPCDGGQGGFRGVTGRKPIIPVGAIRVSRRDAGSALCRALGL